jgi:sugar/nucleoside kinase (ribokinase family)
MRAIVFGNVTLDVICRTIDEVPRYESMAFDHVTISPGGCASNVAIGLSSLGIDTGLICNIGNDDAGALLQKTWKKYDIDLRYIRVIEDMTTAVSIGLVDSKSQPRFIHTPGANRSLVSEDISMAIEAIDRGVKVVHIAGFFVLPSLLNTKFPEQLKKLKSRDTLITLDVVYSPRYWKPKYLFPCLNYIDVFMCNEKEGERLTSLTGPENITNYLHSKGANTIVIKLGGEGCYYNDKYSMGFVDAERVPVVDTTGAGDAFAAGLISALIQGKDIREACEMGNRTGSRMVSSPGAIGGWVCH